MTTTPETTIDTTYDGHEYTMVLGPLGAGRRSLVLYRDGVWAAGDGHVRYLGEDGDAGAVIDDCSAALGEDVYEHLEDVLADAPEPTR